jgi:methylase of polypeptide subunit release factors
VVDSFYTPSDLASRLVNHVKIIKVKNVIDFCIGNGELIRAALKKWPDIKCYGTDISENAIKIVKTLST